MRCTATVGATVAAVVLQLVGTLCVAFVIAIAVSCDAMGDPDSQMTCGGHTVGQPCVDDANIAVCNALVDNGCAEEDIVVAESCPLQFACATQSGPRPGPTGRRQQQAYEECGPAGVCGDHAHCVSACDQEICSSVRCQCEEGFEPHVDSSRSSITTTCVQPAALGGAPTPAPAAFSCGGSSDGPCEASAVRSSTGSAVGHPNLCSAAGPDWITTKVLGVIGGVLLVSATPLLSCQADRCTGCNGRREGAGAQLASRAWQLYALASSGFVVCGALGIGFSVSISMAVPAVMICAFDTAFIAMWWARTQDQQGLCSSSEAASQVVPLVVVASAVASSNEKL